MTAMKQVRRAVTAAIENAGCAAAGAYDEERLKRRDCAVAAVGLREARIEGAGLTDYLGRRVSEETQESVEVYGRQMTLALSLDVYAPRTLGAAGCETAAETITQAMLTALPEGLRLEALKWDEIAWDKTSGMFRLCARAEYRAYFVAEAADENTVFTDFVLKGTVKEHE